MMVNGRRPKRARLDESMITDTGRGRSRDAGDCGRTRCVSDTMELTMPRRARLKSRSPAARGKRINTSTVRMIAVLSLPRHNRRPSQGCADHEGEDDRQNADDQRQPAAITSRASMSGPSSSVRAGSSACRYGEPADHRALIRDRPGRHGANNRTGDQQQNKAQTIATLSRRMPAANGSP